MENEPEKPEDIHEKLRDQILSMVKKDQEMRGSDQWTPEIDKANTQRMKEIIKKHGWPNKSFVGEEASHGAWLLVQHSDDIEWQKEALGLLKEAANLGEADKSEVAYLTDRIKIKSGQPQVFGTQFYKDKEGKFDHYPIEDPDQLDKRRQEYGLELFSEYNRKMRESFQEFEDKQ